ncbi:MAG: MFS transporter [Candidatus Lokiarchaeota archaeon]|nr:MFS transporter [Candidatus Lokiarchaeota archaeon]
MFEEVILKERKGNNYLKRINIIIFMVYLLEAWVSYAIFTVLSYYLGTVLLIHPITIGMIGSIGLVPLALKIIIAPFIDRYKLPLFLDKKWSWLFIGLVFNGVFLALFCIDIKNFLSVFAVILFFQSIGMVIMDATVDAIAVQSKERQTSAQASISMFSGVVFGGLLSFFFVGFFEASYPIGYFVMGIVVSCFIPILYKIKKGINLDHLAKTPEHVDWQVIKALFRDHKYLLVILISFLFNIDAGMLEFTFEPYLGLIFHVKLNDIAIIYLVTFLASIAVMISFYKFQEQMTSRIVVGLVLISMYSGMLSLLMSILILMQVLTFSHIVIIYVLWGAVSGATIMLVYTLFVEHSSVKIPAFSIVFLISINNLGRLVGVFVGGFIHIGMIYLISAILILGRIFPLFFLTRRKT